MDMSPSYACPLAVGDEALVSGTLCGKNDLGGTTVFTHSGTTCRVTRSFWDYETGWRFVGKVVDPDAEAELRRQSTTGCTPEHYREKYPDQPAHYERTKAASDAYDPSVVYFSEHDLAPSARPAP